jgi:hypothetical protein
MADLSDYWVSEHARYDESVFRARERIESNWPKNAPVNVADVKGYFGDFLVLGEAQPDSDRLYRVLLMISGHELHHRPKGIVELAAHDMTRRYEEALASG